MGAFYPTMVYCLIANRSRRVVDDAGLRCRGISRPSCLPQRSVAFGPQWGGILGIGWFWLRLGANRRIYNLESAKEFDRISGNCRVVS